MFSNLFEEWMGQWEGERWLGSKKRRERGAIIVMLNKIKLLYKRLKHLITIILFTQRKKYLNTIEAVD